MIVSCPTSAIKHAFVNMTSEKQVFLARSHIFSRKPRWVLVMGLPTLTLVF